MIVLGRITAPFGVAGWVRVHAFGDDPLSWRVMKQWWLGADAQAAGGWQPYTLKGCREHSGSLVAKFAEVGDRSGAEMLQGLYVAAPREALPATAQNEYYWADLIGLTVVNAAGHELGVVQELIATGANEVLVVRDEQQNERLLPFVAQVIEKVDSAQRRIYVAWEADW